MLRTYVNGKVVQESSLDGMIWDVAYLVTDLARMMTLLPGDLILSGTPANSRPVNPGDVVAVEVEGLGRLENTIVEGDAPVSAEAGWPPAASEKVLGVALGEQLQGVGAQRRLRLRRAEALVGEVNRRRAALPASRASGGSPDR